MVRMFAKSTEEKVPGTESICPTYRKELATPGMSFAITISAWLRYLKKNLDDFGTTSLGAQDALLKKAF